jgi:transglutaminase-like putative cysteine protease
MQLSITHGTRYEYRTEVSESHMELRLQPWSGGGQHVHSHELDVKPPGRVRAYVDGFGNDVHYFNRLAPLLTLEIVSRSRVETSPAPAIRPLELFPSDLMLFRAPVLNTTAVRRLARRGQLRDPGSRESVLEFLDRLVGAIARGLTYTPDVTTVSTDVEEVLRLGRGVCQDFVHVFIAAVRTAGVPCRYVSGYIYEGAGEPVVGASHAWAEAWVPDRGWTAYDPTHPGLAAEHYVRIAVGRDYRDAAPTRGVFVGVGSSSLEVRVEIAPVG